MKLKRILSGTLAFILGLSVINFSAFAEDRLPAFPGAEGGGMYASGARGGNSIVVYHVTNLNDSGEGSFRDAVSEGNRIIVFDVAGTVMLKTPVKIQKSNITVLGQTAPGEGICIGGDSVMLSNADNIIMRYLRFRMGDDHNTQEDSLGIRRGQNIIIDHCSISWCQDECLSAYQNKNFTAQWCIISESLKESYHEKGSHGYGGIWGGINASFHHNLIATHDSRVPRIGTSQTVHTYEDSLDTDNLIDVRNNVIYNWGLNSSYGGENGTRVNLINNYYKPTEMAKRIGFFEIYRGTKGIGGGTTLYVDGNIMENNAALTADNWQGVTKEIDSTKWNKCENITDGVVVDGVLKSNNEYIEDYPISTDTAQEAYNRVLQEAGASYNRDNTDKRVVDDVKNGTLPTGNKSGVGFVDSPNDVGGYDSLYGNSQLDSDNDGIPDDWENEHGLNPNDSSDAIQLKNGYTNIEVYANSLVENKINLSTKDINEKIKYVDTLNSREYTTGSWKALMAAVNEAKTVLGNNKSTQSDVDNSLSSINTAISGLIKGGSEEPKSYTGDIDLDGEVTASDSALLFQYVLNKSYIPIESVDLKYADIDHNNVIDSIDVAHILQKSLDSSYNIENITNPITTEVTTETSTENIETVTEESTSQALEKIGSLNIGDLSGDKLTEEYSKDGFILRGAMDNIINIGNSPKVIYNGSIYSKNILFVNNHFYNINFKCDDKCTLGLLIGNVNNNDNYIRVIDNNTNELVKTERNEIKNGYVYVEFPYGGDFRIATNQYDTICYRMDLYKNIN